MSKIVPRVRDSAPAPFEDAFSQMDRMLDEFRTSFLTAPWSLGRTSELLPALTDVEDTGDAYRVKMDLPGIPKEKIDIRLNGSLLSVDAQQESSHEEKTSNYLRRERSYTGFHRAFELPEPVLSDKVDASYHDGVLEIAVPKSRPVTEQKIAVH